MEGMRVSRPNTHSGCRPMKLELIDQTHTVKSAGMEGMRVSRPNTHSGCRPMKVDHSEERWNGGNESQ